MNAANDSLRVRVTPYCNLNCDFCHEEGGDASCPISLSQVVEITKFAHEHGFNKFHLTGGEPSCHPELVGIVRIITGAGFPCGITTNGQFRSSLLAELRDAGVTSLNFSIHTVDPAAWAQVQQHSDTRKAAAQISRAIENMKQSVALGIRTKVNIVVGEDAAQAIGVIEALRGSGVEIRLLSLLGSNDSLINLDYLLGHYEAEIVDEMRVLDSSQYRSTYNSTAGVLVVKNIHPHRELAVCKGCKENCLEGFYGVRLIPMEEDILVRLCIHRTCENTLMSLSAFAEGPQLSALKSRGGLNCNHQEVSHEGYNLTGARICSA